MSSTPQRIRSMFAILTLIVVTLIVAVDGRAQEPVWVKPAPASIPAQQPAPASHPPPPAQEPAAPPADNAQVPAQEIPASGKNKPESTGPRTLVELPPTPMLDEEGHQRLDPDGKPLFNPPVRQQRDKHGNPVFDEAGKPVMQTPGQMGYGENGKKMHDKKEKAPKTLSISIERGTFTIDGLTGKAGLNYDIKNLRYVYLYAPWIGVTIVSPSPFPGGKEQKNAFKDHTLTVTVEDHTLQLASEKQMLGKKPESAFVAVDRSFKLASKFPVVGYGETLKAPYAWPGSHENLALKGTIAAPPLPESVRPATLLQPCPEGQMRTTGKMSSPGETPAAQLCVPIDASGPNTDASRPSQSPGKSVDAPTAGTKPQP